jgi:hypothetical protein
MKKGTGTETGKRKRGKVLPRGWNEKRVREVIDYYNRQTEDEELAEYEAGMELEGFQVMLVPTALVPEVRQLIARRAGA